MPPAAAVGLDEQSLPAEAWSMPPAEAAGLDEHPLPAEYAVLRVGSDEEDELQTADALANVQNLRVLLGAARARGRRFRRRVQLPTLAFGAVLLLCGLILRGTALLKLTPGDENLNAVALFQAILPTTVGLVVLIFFVDARERILVRRVLVLLACNGIIFACGAATIPFTIATKQIFTEDGKEICVALGVTKRGPLQPCAFVFVMLFTTSITVLALVAWVVAVIRGLFSPTMRARDLLEAATENTGRLLFVNGICILLPLFVAAAYGMTQKTVYWAMFGLSGAELVAFSFLFRTRGLHKRVQSWLAARSEATSTASGVASLLNERDFSTITALAKLNFRAVSAEFVTQDALSSSAPDPALQSLAMRCTFGECDAFITHSWSDDPRAKWQALQTWRKEFERRRGRAPMVWIDRLCIDQSAIADNLACLPVFMAGCQTLLALAGPTWLTRLWCVVEVHVWIWCNSGNSEGTIEMIDITQSQETQSLETLKELANDRRSGGSRFSSSSNGADGSSSLRSSRMRLSSNGSKGSEEGMSRKSSMCSISSSRKSSICSIGSSRKSSVVQTVREREGAPSAASSSSNIVLSPSSLPTVYVTQTSPEIIHVSPARSPHSLVHSIYAQPLSTSRQDRTAGWEAKLASPIRSPTLKAKSSAASASRRWGTNWTRGSDRIKPVASSANPSRRVQEGGGAETGQGCFLSRHNSPSQASSSDREQNDSFRTHAETLPDSMVLLDSSDDLPALAQNPVQIRSSVGMGKARGDIGRSSSSMQTQSSHSLQEFNLNRASHDPRAIPEGGHSLGPSDSLQLPSVAREFQTRENGKCTYTPPLSRRKNSKSPPREGEGTTSHRNSSPSPRFSQSALYMPTQGRNTPENRFLLLL